MGKGRDGAGEGGSPTARDGIRITMVEPGAVATELTDLIIDEEVHEGLNQRSIKPLQPEEIANT
jgi:NADP-dependent 3-hydroxy acid dehydrogenase YdfG